MMFECIYGICFEFLTLSFLCNRKHEPEVKSGHLKHSKLYTISFWQTWQELESRAFDVMLN